MRQEQITTYLSRIRGRHTDDEGRGESSFLKGSIYKPEVVKGQQWKENILEKEMLAWAKGGSNLF